MADMDPAHDASAHRQRLRQRLFNGGPDALLDHELIEYLLGLSIRRRDTKPLARRLLVEFGGLGGLLTTEASSLTRAGLGETTIAVLKSVQAAALRLLKSEIQDRPVLASWQAVSDYLHADMAHRLNEAVRVLHLNSRNMLIRDELVSEGTIDQSAIHVREVMRRVLELGSAAVILVHNHPSGDPSPSKQDIALTRAVVQALKSIDVHLHDHVIVGRERQLSLRAQGLI